ncbi:MAG: lysophospholipid acyltransferase family protein, partial [Niameybacter sp.]
MFRTIYWYGYFAISLICTLPALRKAKKLVASGNLKEAEAYINQTTMKWAMAQVKNGGADVKVHGLENIPHDKPVVFMSNHQGNFDIALFMSFIEKPKGYVAKLETNKIYILRDWMRLIHCVFMDRSTLKGAASAIIEGVKLIKEGHSLVIFPEGTRSKGGPLGEFKGGSFKLATKPKVPIVPVTIDGTYKLMEAQGGKVKPATVHMYIHPPIPTADLT